MVTALASLGNFSTATADDIACSPIDAKGPLLINADCIDPDFARPVIDSRFDIKSPVPFHKVSGHFDGTKATFNFYFPPKDTWHGRFFQNVYPLTDGNAGEDTLGFATSSGAYTVQTGNTSGYRADAAAAKFSRKVARQYYGLTDEHIYGYIYGGSGGSYQTIAGMENSQGVWDGAVPYVMGVPTSIPNNFFVRAFARLVLESKSGQIADAVRPGKSGDLYAALNETERDVLKEVSAMGLPLGGWTNPSYLLGLEDPRGLMSFGDTVKRMDPTYADDFWSKPGYLGTEKSALGDIFRAARVDVTLTVNADRNSSGTFMLENVPSHGHIRDFEYTLIDKAGKPLGPVTGSLDIASKRFTINDTISTEVLETLGDVGAIHIDNRWTIALTAYHRYQVPREPGITVWNQFLKADGTPIYPQRSIEVGPIISSGASGGGKFTGRFEGKMIVVGNLLDVDAYPWHGDWYFQRVKGVLGPDVDDRFRLWFNENADHLDGSVIASGNPEEKTVRLVNYVGIVQQAVKDVSAWVENGRSPSLTSSYEVTDGQVSVSAQASERHGIQPTVVLTTDGGPAIEVHVGEPVTLHGRIELPDHVGEIVATEWNPLGHGDFEFAAFARSEDGTIIATKTVIFPRPGSYYPVLRVTSQRTGDASSRFGRVQNLDRVRVVVK